MDKILSITDWYDCPVLGVAFCGDELVIFERVFSEEDDEYTDEYYLTPISISELVIIMRYWTEWVNHINNGTYFDKSKEDPTIGILKRSNNRRKYKKRADFHINRRKGTILDGYWVEWLSLSEIDEKTHRER